MKKYILGISILLISVIFVFSVRPLCKISSKLFWDSVAVGLDKEEQERQRRIENGELFRGKDTVLIWENMYEIGHYADGNRLEIHTNGISEPILEKITAHKVVKSKLYVISEEGYAVINKDNLCKVYIAPEDELAGEDSTDCREDVFYNNKRVENNNIQYLSEFGDFSEEEKKIIIKFRL